MRPIIERVSAGGASAAVTRLIRPGMHRARLRSSARSASRAQWSGAMGDIGILSGSRPKSASAGVRVGPGVQHRHVHTVLGQLDVQAGAQAGDVGLGRCSVRNVRHAVDRAERGDQHDAAAAASRESFAEVVAQAQMCGGIQAQDRPLRLQAGVQERPGQRRAGVGNQKADVDVGGGVSDQRQRARVGQVNANGATVDAVVPSQRSLQVLQHGQAPRDQYHVDALQRRADGRIRARFPTTRPLRPPTGRTDLH